MNKIVKVITASVLSVSMCGCAVSADEASATASADTVSTEKKSSKKDADEAYTSEQTGKDETVYVFTGADGNMDHMVVSDTLHTAGKKGAVEDYSNLDNIENVSGDEEYSSDDNGNITWTSDGTDISYQGTTDKELPVDVKVTYYLNDNEVSPEEIKGQSGHVKVHFDYTNNAETTINSNGEDKTVKVPFGMVTGLTLDASKFTNVTVTNGKMNQYNDSDVIYGLALPGLKESLETASVSDIDLTSIDIPEYFEFEADTTDFDIDLCMTIATSNVLSLLNTDDLNVSDFSDSVDKLTSSGQELVDGTKSLKDGTAQLKSGADSLDSGAQTLVNGIGTLNDGASSLNDGAASLADGAQTLNDGAKSVNDGAASLASGAQSLSDGANTVNDGANSLASGAQSLADGAQSLDDGAATALSGAQTLSSGLGELSGNSAALNDGYHQVVNGIFALVNSVLKSKNLPEVTEDDYVQKFSDLLGVTDSMRSTALSTVADTADVTEDVAKYLIIKSAQKYGAADALKSENLAAVGEELKQQAAAAQTVGQKAEKATASAADEPYNKDQAVVAVLNGIVESQAYNQVISKLSQELQGSTTDQTTVKKIFAYSIQNGKSVSEAATAVLSGTAVDSYDLSDSTVKNYIDTNYVNDTSRKSAYDAAISQITAGGASAKLAPVVLVYACQNYASLSGSSLTEKVNAAADEMSSANSLSSTMQKTVSDNETLLNSILTSAVQSNDDYSSLGTLLDLLNGAEAYGSQLKKYTDGADSAYAGAQKLVDGLGDLKTGADQLNSGAQTLLSGSNTLAAGTKSLADGAGTLLTGSNTLASGTQTLYNGTGSLLTGSNSLRDGAAELFSGVGKVKAGAQTLKDGTASLKSGVVTLDDGAATLEAGMEQFYEEGIKKIGDVLGEDLPAVVDSLKGLTNAGADYQTFSGALDDDNNTCKFIFKTEFDSEN